MSDDMRLLINAIRATNAQYRGFNPPLPSYFETLALRLMEGPSSVGVETAPALTRNAPRPHDP